MYIVWHTYITYESIYFFKISKWFSRQKSSGLIAHLGNIIPDNNEPIRITHGMEIYYQYMLLHCDDDYYVE